MAPISGTEPSHATAESVVGSSNQRSGAPVRPWAPPVSKLQILACLLALWTVAVVLGLPRIDGDSAVYALLAKHMVQTHNWVDLVYRGADWLDKPHFPFWMAALSFSVFGINARAYLVPGLALYFVGAFYTQRMASLLVNRSVAWMALLIYLSLFGSLIATSDQKAEVYLLGLVTGASYHWLRFCRSAQWRPMLAAAAFAACALMTKGIFVLIILASGPLATLALYRKTWPHPVWWKYAVCSLAVLLLAAPEFISLFLQFDSHPERVVFGRTGVSGIRFFLWDSQFGRFLNTGPIRNSKGQPWFYLHNLIWTFLPWVTVLLAAAIGLVRRTWAQTQASITATPVLPAEVFLWASFLSAFLMFSATSYQMDYYLVVVFPYAAILCANWLCDGAGAFPSWWRHLHRGLASVTWLATCIAVGAYALRQPSIFMILLMAALLLLPLAGRHFWHANQAPKGLLLGIVAVAGLFGLSVQVHRDLYLHYNLGQNVANVVNQQSPAPLVLMHIDANTLDFLSHVQVFHTENSLQVDQLLKSNPNLHRFYLLTASESLPALRAQLMLPGICTEPNSGNAMVAPGARTCSARWQEQVVQEFIELRLPSQFIQQWLRNDDKLPRQMYTLVLISLN